MPELKTWTIEQGLDHNKQPLPKLSFEGELLATVTNGDARRDYRWSEMSAWRTKAGRIVVQTIGYSRVEGEVTTYHASVFEDMKEAQLRMKVTKYNQRLWRAIGVETLHIG